MNNSMTPMLTHPHTVRKPVPTFLIRGAPLGMDTKNTIHGKIHKPHIRIEYPVGEIHLAVGIRMEELLINLHRDRQNNY